MIKKFQDKVCASSAMSYLIISNISQLPDIDFPINAMAEGRILVPWEHVQDPSSAEGMPAIDFEWILT